MFTTKKQILVKLRKGYRLLIPLLFLSFQVEEGVIIWTLLGSLEQLQICLYPTTEVEGVEEAVGVAIGKSNF